MARLWALEVQGMRQYGMTRNDAEIYQCVSWNMQEARKQLVKLSDELGFGNYKGELSISAHTSINTLRV